MDKKVECKRCYEEARVAVQGLRPALDYGEVYDQEIAARMDPAVHIVYPGGETVCAKHLAVAKQTAEHILLTSGGSLEEVIIKEL